MSNVDYVVIDVSDSFTLNAESGAIPTWEGEEMCKQKIFSLPSDSRYSARKSRFVWLQIAILILVAPLALGWLNPVYAQDEGGSQDSQSEPSSLEPLPLFSDLPDDTMDQPPIEYQPDTGSIRSRLTDVFLDLLGTIERPSTNLKLNLFDDIGLIAELDRTAVNSAGGLTWVGHIQSVTNSQVVLVETNGMLGGLIAMPGESFLIRSIGGEHHAIEQIDQSQYPDEIQPIDIGTAEDPPIHSAAIQVDDPCNEIRVLVAYSPAARTAAGGTAAIENTIALAIADSNQSYVNSGINQSLVLAHTMVAPDSVDNFGIDLSALSNLTDGSFDDVDVARETYSADMVALLIEDTQYCGLAYLNSTAAGAFSVTARACAVGNHSFAHELGHNMGARHDWYVDDTINYNKGYVNVAARWRTIMAYNSRCSATPPGTYCPRLQYWSNPDITYGNPPVPMGVIETGPVNCDEGSMTPDPSTCAANNALRLNNRCSTVANFRDAELDTDATPASYGTSQHVRTDNLVIGDSNIIDDGATFLALPASGLYTVDAGVTNNSGQTAQLVGWIDVAGDGSFSQLSDRSNPDLVGGTGNAGDGTFVTGNIPDGFAGTVTLQWNIAGPVAVNTWARLRLTTDPSFFSDSSPEPTGLIGVGESEGLPVPDPSLPVTLGYFVASRDGDAVNFTWQTSTEAGTAGFNLLAEVDEELTPLNEELIPSAAIDSITPIDYSYNATTEATLFYLEEIDINGAKERHGPFVLGKEFGVYVQMDAGDESSLNHRLYLPTFFVP